MVFVLAALRAFKNVNFETNTINLIANLSGRIVNVLPVNIFGSTVICVEIAIFAP
jgi:hypothetical protein